MLTQTRMGIGSALFPGTGPMKGQYVFLMSKSSLYIFSIDNYYNLV